MLFTLSNKITYNTKKTQCASNNLEKIISNEVQFQYSMKLYAP